LHENNLQVVRFKQFIYVNETPMTVMTISDDDDYDKTVF